MGAGSSIGNLDPSGNSSEGNCCDHAVEDFDSLNLSELASQYHHRLRQSRKTREDAKMYGDTTSSISLETAALAQRSQSLSPISPRAQCPRPPRLHEGASFADAGYNTHARVEAGVLPVGSRYLQRLSGFRSEEAQRIGRAGMFENFAHELHGRSSSEFVKKDDIARVARDLGYDLNQIQGVKLFDMLDLRGEGKISRDDIIEHFLPLLQTVEPTLPKSGKEPSGRGHSYMAPRRSLPGSPALTKKVLSHSSKMPPRPAGDPPLTAKRRVTSPAHKGCTEASTITLSPIKSTDLTVRPAKFWVTRQPTAILIDADSNDDAPNNAGGVLSDIYDGHGLASLQAKIQVCDSGKRREVQPTGTGGEVVGTRSEGRICGQAKGNDRLGESTEHNNLQAKIQVCDSGKRREVQPTGTGGEVVGTRSEGRICGQAKGNDRLGESTEHTKPRKDYQGGDDDAEKEDKVCTCPSISPPGYGGTQAENEGVAGGRVARGEGLDKTNLLVDSNKSISAELHMRRSVLTHPRGGLGQRCLSVTWSVPLAVPSPANVMNNKTILDWTPADVRAWLLVLPRGLAAFAEAQAFLDGTVDGKRLATLTLTDLKRKEFHHSGFRLKVPTALWKEIKQVQTTPSASVATKTVSRFSAEEDIVDETFRIPICTVKRFVGQGEFGEVYEVVWAGVGKDRGATMAMKTVRLADVSSEKRDECRILLIEEILTAVRVKSHPNVVNVRHAHIMGFCTEGEEYFSFQDFVTGRDLETVIAEENGQLYSGTAAEIQGRLLSYCIQLARGLGHIHRCGVLHQDIKSANVMVNNDEQLLITDFGFATVGYFGPPRVVVARCAKGDDSREGDRGEYDQRDGAREGEGVPEVEGAPSQGCVLFGTLKGYTPRYQSPEISAIMREKINKSNEPPSTSHQKASTFTSSSATREEARTPYTHLSDVWAAGVLILEMYAGTLAGLKDGLGENASGLLEALTQSRESNTILGLDYFRVDMPEEVRHVLRQIFDQDPGKRPPSMEVIAIRLSRALGWLVKEGLALVPCPTSGSPSSSSPCKEEKVFDEDEENHGKLGRLHMWLGKALSLKGDIYQDQVLQEYREGVRVLEQSKIDRGSSSMALFRWYLGTVLLETGKIEEALNHLAEAVMIDKDSPKYHYTLGMAKRAAGDERGAREEFDLAAHLDEENAEERNEIFVRRQRAEKFRISDTNASDVSASPPGVITDIRSSEAVEGCQQGKTIERNLASAEISASYHLQRNAMGRQASSAQTYTLDGLDGYRARTSVSKVGDYRSGNIGPLNISGSVHDDKAIRYSRNINLHEIRHFSIGDKVMCRKDRNARSRGPLACHPLSCDGAGDCAENCKTVAIIGVLLEGQASLDLWGEAYTAKVGSHREAGAGESMASSSFCHVVHIRFERDVKPATAIIPPVSSFSIAGASHSAGSRGKSLNKATATYQHEAARGVKRLNEPSRRTCVGTTFLRDADYVPTLKAIGRAAMVDSHVGLAGAIWDFTWGPNELTLIAAGLPNECVTLREVLSSRLYRGNGISEGVAEQKIGLEGVVVNRMLTIAKQTAAAISHCHRRGVLLQGITPDAVLVTPKWEAILRPNYAHAREGRYWIDAPPRENKPAAEAAATTKVRQQLQHPRMSQSLPGDEPLSAPFSNATSRDYQGPEINRMRQETYLHGRPPRHALHQPDLSQLPVITRGTDLTAQLTPPANVSIGQSAKHLGQNANSIGRGSKKPAGESARIDGSNSGTKGDSHTAESANFWGGMSAKVCVRQSLDAEDNTESTLLPYLNASGGGSSQEASSLRGIGESSRVATVTPCSSDIWAWALVVLGMFTDELWPPGSGEDGLSALESLLARRQGVESWSTEDVVSWLKAIGVWSEGIEKEIRTFKIAGPQLMVPVCRRDVVERLGLFIMDVESSRRLWEAIASGLQRWTVPPRLAQILRRCFATDPRDRFSSMDEVCKLLGEVVVDSGAHSAASATNERMICGDPCPNLTRTAMLLNNIGVCMSRKDHLVEEAEAYYKMSLRANREIPEPHYNLGLIYMSPSFDKFKEAQHAFESATALMNVSDPRRKSSVEQAKAAERKSVYFQSQEVMKSLSGKFSSNASMSPKGS